MSCESDLYNYLIKIGILYTKKESCNFPLLLPYNPINTDYYFFQLNYNFGQERCYKVFQQYKDGFEKIKAFRIGKEIVAYALVNQEYTLIQFLPALTKCQWIYSFQSEPTLYNGFNVHSGLLHYYTLLKNNILNFLKKHTSKKLFYSGYSLGSVAATLLAMEYLPNDIYIWGSPPFIDKKGVHWIEKNLPYKGWINLSDPVTSNQLNPIYKPVLKSSIVFNIDYKDPHFNHLYSYSDYLSLEPSRL